MLVVFFYLSMRGIGDQFSSRLDYWALFTIFCFGFVNNEFGAGLADSAMLG